MNIGLRVPQSISTHDDIAPLEGLEAVDATQEGRLASAARPNDDDNLAPLDRAANATQHFEGSEELMHALGSHHLVWPEVGHRSAGFRLAASQLKHFRAPRRVADSLNPTTESRGSSGSLLVAGRANYCTHDEAAQWPLRL
jgi:hypothetical protein